MAPIKELFASSALISVVLTRYVPQYSIGYLLTGLALFFLQFLGFLTWRIVIYPKLVSPLRHLPQPAGASFFMGQSARIMKEASGMPMRDWVETVPNDGLIRYTHWLNQERLLVTTPKTLGEVLVTKNYDFIKPAHFRNGLGRILGIGILLAEGDEHKTQRKNLMPAFAYRHVKDLYPVFWSKSREMVECLSKASKSSVPTSEEKGSSVTDPEKAGDVQHAPGIVEVGSWTSRAALDIIGLSGMGKDFGALENPENVLNQTYRIIFNPSRNARLLQLAGMFLPTWFLRRIPIKRNGEIEAASALIKQTCRDLIARKRRAMQEKERVEVDILSVALESGGFTDEELVNQMMTYDRYFLSHALIND